VGTDRAGTPSDYGTRVSLTLMGFKPESDVQLLRIGSSAILWPALQSGQIAGAALTPPQSFKADAAGYAHLVNTYNLPYQNIGVVVRRSDVEPREETWARFLRSPKEGIQRWYDDPNLAKDVLTKYTREEDPEMLQKMYDFFTKQAGFNRELTPTDHGIQQILTFLGSTVLPAAKGATPHSSTIHGSSIDCASSCPFSLRRYESFPQLDQAKRVCARWRKGSMKETREIADRGRIEISYRWQERPTTVQGHLNSLFKSGQRL
jgi:hypothetical protein